MPVCWQRRAPICPTEIEPAETGLRALLVSQVSYDAKQMKKNELIHPGSVNADSLAGKVVGYLTLYPSRELSLDEISEKFSSSRSCQNIHAQLQRVVNTGYISYDVAAATYKKGDRPIPSVLCEFGAMAH